MTTTMNETNESPAPESSAMGDLLECKSCGHLVPAQNMVVHELTACQARKQQPDALSPLHQDEEEHQEALLQQQEPLIPYEVSEILPVAASAAERPLSDDEISTMPIDHDGYVILPSSSSKIIPSETNHEQVSVLPPPQLTPAVTGVEGSASPTPLVGPSSNFGTNLWKKITKAWEKLTSCGEDTTNSYPASSSSRNNGNSPNSRKRRADEMAHSENTWNCPRCTLINPELSQKCEACRYVNPSVATTRSTQQRSRAQNPSFATNNQQQRPNYFSGGAILGGAMGMAGAALTGQNPIVGLFQGSVNGAIVGSIAENAARTQEHMQQTGHQRRGRNSGYHNNSSRVRVIRRQLPNGTIVISTHPSHEASVNNDPRARAMMESMARPGSHRTNRRGVDGMHYEQLLDAYGTGTENLGATRQQIQSLPCSKVRDPNALPKDKQECPICLEKFGKGDTVKTLPCLHAFHETCVNHWLNTNASCPICKHRID